MSTSHRILVSAERGESRVAITRDAQGGAWLAHGRAPALHPITPLAGLNPAQVGGPGWTAIGGVLPASARTAHVCGSDGRWVRAEAARGAWVAFVAADEHHHLPPVRFQDAHGAVVSRADAAALASARRIP